MPPVKRKANQEEVKENISFTTSGVVVLDDSVDYSSHQTLDVIQGMMVFFGQHWAMLKDPFFFQRDVLSQFSDQSLHDAFSLLHKEFWEMLVDCDIVANEVLLDDSDRPPLFNKLKWFLFDDDNVGAFGEIYQKMFSFLKQRRDLKASVDASGGSVRAASEESARRTVSEPPIKKAASGGTASSSGGSVGKKIERLVEFFYANQAAMLAPLKSPDLIRRMIERQPEVGTLINELNEKLTAVLNTEEKQLAYYQALTGCSEYGGVGKLSYDFSDGDVKPFTRFLCLNQDVLPVFYDNAKLIEGYIKAFNFHLITGEQSHQLESLLTSSKCFAVLRDMKTHSAVFHTYLKKENYAVLEASSLASQLQAVVSVPDISLDPHFELDEAMQSEVKQRVVPFLMKEDKSLCSFLMKFEGAILTCASAVYSDVTRPGQSIQQPPPASVSDTVQGAGSESSSSTQGALHSSGLFSSARQAAGQLSSPGVNTAFSGEVVSVPVPVTP